MTALSLSVMVAPAFDPGTARIIATLEEGLTIAEIVGAMIPWMSESDLGRVRVALVNTRGSMIVQAELWHRVRPRAGVQIVIRIVPAGDDALRSVLSIVVTIAAVALAAYFAPMLAGTLGLSASTWGAAVTLGVNLVGNLLINALIPPASQDQERRPSYSITGWRNRLEPDGAVPVVLGAIRFALPFATPPFTEIIGDWQYWNALFVVGEGRVGITDIRIGETSISEFDEVEIETRQGQGSDLPVSLCPTQIVEESIGVELTRPLPRDDLGEVIDDEDAIETPVVRTTGPDAKGASVILGWPAGLVGFDDDGDQKSRTVVIRIEQRLVEAEEWSLVLDLEITAKRAEGFFRQHSWNFPSRSRWQVRLTMMTDESKSAQVQQRTVWAALQTLRPEYPIAYDHPLALVAVRIKATHQLNGALDNVSVLASRICTDWDHDTETWTTRATSNPASLYRHVLQSAANPKAVGNAEIDLAALQDWHDFCRVKGLRYNRVLEEAGTTLRDVLTEIAAAGRASPRHDGLKWGVVIDRPSDLIVDHVSPRNSWNFSLSRSYVEKPHAFIVKFQDEDNDFKEARRVVPRPGFEGDITLTETLDIPGVTDAAIIFREATRRFFEAEYRADQFEVTQAGAARVATRGDVVALSHDVLRRTQIAARVRSVVGSMIELDELVTMVTGKTYAVRFRSGIGSGDTIGDSTVRNVATAPGETEILTVTGTGQMPEEGDLLHFGEAATVSFQVIVTGVEATDDQCSVIRAVEAAPIIDELIDALDIPAWSSRVGEEIEDNLIEPSAPRFSFVGSGVEGAGAADLIRYLLEPGSGAIRTAAYEVQHRPGTSGGWTTVTISVAAGGGKISAYDAGDTVQLRARAKSPTDVPGPYSSTVTIVVGADDAPIPAALDDDAVTVTTLLGGALIQVTTGTDSATTRLQVYRSTSGTLDRETDAAGKPQAVSRQQSYSLALGDTTRSNLIVGGSMGNPADWDLDAGWAIAGGDATHTPGTGDDISQGRSFTTGKWYRIGFSVAGRTAGNLTPELRGGSVQSGTAVTANGSRRDRIQAVSGNNRLAFAASSAFDGALDNVVAYLETAACLAQGTHYIWVEPQNAQGLPGPVSGPFTISIT